MKIAFCGSMTFAKEMVDLKRTLEQRGHTIILPKDTEEYAAGGKQEESMQAKIHGDLVTRYFHEIEKCDAVLIVNITKNGIEHYVGGNALIEMAFGHVLGKKVFLLHPIPDVAYKDEIGAMQPSILHGDVTLLC